MAPPAGHDCLDAQLRLRIRSATIQRALSINGDENFYCVVIAADGTHSELLTTSIRGVDRRVNGTTRTDINFTQEEGTFWGQGQLFRSSANLNINYRCFKVVDTERTRRILGSIGTTAATVGGVAGPSTLGWVFTAVGAAANIAAAAVTNAGDDAWLDVQQTISAEAFYNLTNGRSWEIDDHASGLDVRLRIEAWGCASPRPGRIQ